MAGFVLDGEMLHFTHDDERLGCGLPVPVGWRPGCVVGGRWCFACLRTWGPYGVDWRAAHSDGQVSA